MIPIPLRGESLIVENLNVSRGGKQVLYNVSIRLEPGRVTALLGPNGAGKSTLVQTLAGMLPVDSGSFALGEQQLAGAPPYVIRAKAGIAAVPEGHHVLTKLTVHDNLLAAGSALAWAELQQSVENAYNVFPELREKKNQAAGTLSGGQQQMVSLAQSLIGSPNYILADEMSLGLAPLIVKRLMGVVEEIAAKGVGVLLIEQFTNVALKLADYVYVMDRGHIRFRGTPTELTANPDVLQAAYLGGSG